METYLVGGAVRDKLLKLPVSEKDWVVVGASPREMLDQGYRPVGKDFPVFLHPETGEEYALARTERKTGPGYTGFAFHASTDVTLEQDLLRRDLTINAMAETADGTIIDPCNGRQDLDNGLLRHVSPAFSEDPVRILRVARFAARFGKWGFKVAHGTNALMRKMVENGEVDHLVAERVWAELVKALASDAPQKFFSVLRGCGALAKLFPEIDREYPAGETAHTGKGEIPALAALEAGARHSDDTRVRFSVLLRALGQDLEPEKRCSQAEALCKRLRVPNEYRQLALTTIVTEQYAGSRKPEDILEMMEAAAAFRQGDRWQQLLSVFRAANMMDQAHCDRLTETGRKTAGIGAAQLENQGLSGPAIGEAIRAARLQAIRSAFTEPT